VKKPLTALALFFFAAAAFAHAGHMHTYMGTVTALQNDGSFVIKTTDGKDVTVATSPATTWAHVDGKAATRADLATGMRVVVKMTLDGKTAASVKLSQ
jgi:hypothetical protein